MAQPQFIDRPRAATLAEIAAIADAHLVDATRGGQRVAGLAALQDAGPHHLTYFDNPKHADRLASTMAGACLVSAEFEAAVPGGVTVLRVAAPYRAFVGVATQLHPDALRQKSWYGITGIAASAIVHPTARLEDDVTVDPLAVIGPGVEIGAETVIGAGVVIGAQVRIGRNCSIGPGCAIAFTLIGNGVLIHPGCRIGQDGFGFGFRDGVAPKLPHTGRVLIQHGVEIGAGTTIDRGSLRDTIIGERSKIDGLVRIGHDAWIGRHCRLGAQTGIGAGAALGDRADLGAAAQIHAGLAVGRDAKVVTGGIIDDDRAAAVASQGSGVTPGGPAGGGAS